MFSCQSEKIPVSVNVYSFPRESEGGKVNQLTYSCIVDEFLQYFSKAVKFCCFNTNRPLSTLGVVSHPKALHSPLPAR